MESTSRAAEAAAALRDAEEAGAQVAQRIATPPWFFTSLALAIAIQIATTAVGLAEAMPWILLAGLALFAGVAGVQLSRFRTANGVWLGGLASRVVLGTATTSSIAYVAALAAAVWAAYAGRGWLVGACALLGGGAYALSGRRWLATYRARPSAHARGESAAVLAAAALIALAGLAVLLLDR
jgi:hypothetical protein